MNDDRTDEETNGRNERILGNQMNEIQTQMEKLLNELRIIQHNPRSQNVTLPPALSPEQKKIEAAAQRFYHSAWSVISTVTGGPYASR